MIRLDFHVPTDETWTSWCSECADETEKLIQSYQENNPAEITSLYASQKIRYYDAPFFGKCAYCESKIETTSPNYVEHFRPKKETRNFDNEIVMVIAGENKIPHPGYYWLAYKWENLLPTCWNCNTWHTDKSGVKIGKGNRFPVIGNYAINPGEEQDEIAELINPMLEDPEIYMAVDSLGVLHNVSDSSKGQTTIDVFGLNTREALVNGRKKEYDNTYRKIQLLFTLKNVQERQRELSEIKDIAKGKDEYTIAAKKAIQDVLNLYQETSDLIRSTS